MGEYGIDYFEWAICECPHCKKEGDLYYRYIIDKDDIKRCPSCEYKDQKIIKEGRVYID